MAQTVISRTRLSLHLHQPRFSDLPLTQRHSENLKVNTNSSKVVRKPQERVSATGMQVVHATNGRIRIKATEDSFRSDCQTITQYLQQFTDIKTVTANEQTKSLVISFDAKKLSLTKMLGILQDINIQINQDTPPPSDPLAAWKSVDFWQEQTISLIPLFAGLAVTSRLGISGLASIPVYMITAETMRKVIDVVKPYIVEQMMSGDNTDGEPQSAEQKTAGSEKISDVGSTSVVNKHSQSIKSPMKWSDKVTYSVIHQIPGRIRFHLPLIASDRAYSRRLENLLNNDPIVKSVRLNRDVASIAITYKPDAEITASYWLSLMELAVETKQPQVPVKDISQPESPISQPDRFPSSNNISPPTISLSDSMTELDQINLEPLQNQNIYISSWWADMKFSALSYSLNVMANLPL